MDFHSWGSLFERFEKRVRAEFSARSEADALDRLRELSGPPVAWRPDTDKERADRAATTEALMPAQMESIADRDDRDDGRARLLATVAQLDQFVLQAEVDDLLERWQTIFSKELNTCQRARNTIVYGESISHHNVQAAQRIADRLVDLAEQTRGTERDR